MPILNYRFTHLKHIGRRSILATKTALVKKMTNGIIQLLFSIQIGNINVDLFLNRIL